MGLGSQRYQLSATRRARWCHLSHRGEMQLLGASAHMIGRSSQEFPEFPFDLMWDKDNQSCEESDVSFSSTRTDFKAR